MSKFVFLVSLTIPLSAIEYPSPPAEPTVAAPQVEGAEKEVGRKKNKPASSKAPLAKLKLRIQMGDRSTMVAEAEIPVSYSFTHKKGSVQYNQTITAESIREIQVENYRGRKIATQKDGEVFEFEPYQVRIELKDGQIYKLQYLFKELRKIKARNADGNFTVFAFFADTYKAKSGWQERPDEDFKMLSRRAHPGAFTKIEYFELVDKTGAVEK